MRSSAETSTDAIQPLLRVVGLSKHFGGQYALRDVSLDVLPGEVHGLLGGNGAGKSTLIKILAGVVERDAGEISLSGELVTEHYTIVTAKHGGLAFVHQDLGLVESMTVSENIALSVGHSYRHGLISYRDTERHARQLLNRIGMSAIDPTALVADLSQDARVMVAVARAFGVDARLIILDEISSSLPAPEVARLSESLRAAAAAGIGFVYVTHRLDELQGLVDRVTVLRDGRKIVTRPYDPADQDDLIELIIGEPVAHVDAPNRDARPQSAHSSGPLELKGLLGPGLHAPITTSVQPGEILGVCGLVGCGSRSLAELLGGATAPTSGTALLNGKVLPLGRAAALRREGCSYVPGDRQGHGAVAGMGIRENFYLARLAGGSGLDGVIKRPRAERRAATVLADRLDVRPRAQVEKPLAALSGGNQQKVIAGRAIRSTPQLLVVDDPTAGVDIGARADLHNILRGAAADGAVVVLASTDYDEVASLADRVLVLAGGHVVAELTGEDINADALARNSYLTSNDTNRDDT